MIGSAPSRCRHTQSAYYPRNCRVEYSAPAQQGWQKLARLGFKLRGSRSGRLAFLLGGGLASIIFIGCGGSGGGGSQLQGNPAVRSAAVAGYQALGAGTSFPFELLQVSAPTGNKIPFALGGSLRSILAIAEQTRSTKAPLGGPVLVPALNLYMGAPASVGSVVTVPFYTDSAGTISAGSISVTLPGGSTNYSSYPVTIPMTVNVSGGNIGCKGSGNIVFSDGSGANTLTGTFTLTRTNVVESLNLTLDSAFNVSGSVTVTESNATLSITNLSGSITSDLACNVAVSPTGLTGTGTLNLISGKITMNVKNAAGLASTALIDTSGNLVMSYGDGTNETVTDPYGSTLTSGTTTTGTGSTTGSTTSTGSTTTTGTTGTTTGGATLYNTPTPLGGYVVQAIAPNGAMAGNVLANHTLGQGVYWSSSTAAPVLLQVFAAGDYTTITGVNSNGQIIGTRSNSNLSPQAIYWPSSTGSPVALNVLPNTRTCNPVAINDNGQIVGSLSAVDGQPDRIVYWASPVSQPATLNATGASTPLQAIALANSGQIVGQYSSGSVSPFYLWTSPTAAPQQLQTLSGDPQVYVGGFGTDGTLYGGSGSFGGTTHPVKFSPGSTTPTALLTTTAFPSWEAKGVSNSGDILGGRQVGSNNEGVLLRGTSLYDLDVVVPNTGGYTYFYPSFILGNGSLVLQGASTSSFVWLIATPK